MSDTAAVLEHHLSARRIGIPELLQDYSEESTVISPVDTFDGLVQIRSFYEAWYSVLPSGFDKAFTVVRRDVVGEVAYIMWEARPAFPTGTDTLVVRNGKILYHTFAAHMVEG